MQSLNDIIAKNMGLVTHIAHDFMKKVPASVDVDDLVSVAIVRILSSKKLLIDQPMNDAHLKNTVALISKGGMLDYLRECDIVPRQVRDECKKVEAYLSRFQSINAELPSIKQIGEALNLSEASVKSSLLYKHYRLVSSEAISLSEYHPCESSWGGGDFTIDIEETYDYVRVIEKVMESLNDVDNFIMSSIIYEQLSLDDLEEILLMSKSNVCNRINSKIVPVIKKALRAANLINGRSDDRVEEISAA